MISSRPGPEVLSDGRWDRRASIYSSQIKTVHSSQFVVHSVSRSASRQVTKNQFAVHSCQLSARLAAMVIEAPVGFCGFIDEGEERANRTTGVGGASQLVSESASQQVDELRERARVLRTGAHAAEAHGTRLVRCGQLICTAAAGHGVWDKGLDVSEMGMVGESCWRGLGLDRREFPGRWGTVINYQEPRERVGGLWVGRAIDVR